jgi:hypothetical protein
MLVDRQPKLNTSLSDVVPQPEVIKKGGALSALGAGMRAMTNFPWALGRIFGGFGYNTRNYYETFGWDLAIPDQACWEMYYRGGIAKRIIHAYPTATWANPPVLTATKGWTSAWSKMVLELNIWSVLNRLDVLSRIGRYAILVIGTDDNTNLESPLVPGSATKVTFLQPYSSRAAIISQWGNNPFNERFNMPVMYTINPSIANSEGGGSTGFGGAVPTMGSFRVHWSRVLHIAKGNLESNVYGTPELWAGWNYLTDLQKVVGGASESYWMTANRGIHADLDPDMSLDPAGEAALASEVQSYTDGLQRFIRTRGVTVTNLGSQVADPKGPYGTLIDLLSGTYSIPQRVLTGSESAHQASTQDKATWAENIFYYRALTGNPTFILPLVQALMNMGVLPTQKLEKIVVDWPEAYIMMPLEKAQMENQNATAANNWALAARNITNLATVEELRQKVQLGDTDGTIVPGTAPIAPVGPPDKKGSSEGDGVVGGENGTTKSGPGSGDTATPASDASGQGDPVNPPA